MLGVPAGDGPRDVCPAVAHGVVEGYEVVLFLRQPLVTTDSIVKVVVVTFPALFARASS